MDFSRLNYEVMSDTKMCYESIPLLKYAVRESIRWQYMVEEGLGGVMWLIRGSMAMSKAHFMDKHRIRSPHRHAGMALRYLWKGSPCQTRSRTRP